MAWLALLPLKAGDNTSNPHCDVDLPSCCSVSALRFSFEPMPTVKSGNISIHVRAMRRQDLPACRALHDATLPCAFSNTFFLQCLIQPKLVCFLATRVSNAVEEVLGCLTAQLLPSAVHITSICVANNARKLGVGRSLYRALPKTSQPIVLHCASGNWDARRFYASLGFRETGIVRNYYRTSHWNNGIEWTGAVKSRDAVRFVR